MALTYGFYNSVDGDRTYDAIQFGQIFDGLITDGIYFNYKQGLAVEASESTPDKVIVHPGRAWFNHTWSYNDADEAMTSLAPDTTKDRIDALVLDVDTELAVRRNDFVWVQGTAASKNPQRPALINTATHHQYPLCYIHRYPGQTQIYARDIEDVRGKANPQGVIETPFVAGVLDPIDVSSYISQWDDEFHTWENDTKTTFESWQSATQSAFTSWMITQQETYTSWYNTIKAQMEGDLTDFEAWFESIKGIIDEEAATHLQQEIDDLAAMLPAGSHLTVTTESSSLYLRNVTVSDALGHTQTTKFNSDGVAVFESFPYVGVTTFTASDGAQTATSTLSTPYFGRYAASMAFWSATVNLIADSALGGTVVTVTDASGSSVGSVTLNGEGLATWYAQVADTYTFSITSGGQTMSQSINITQETTYTVSFIPDGATITPTDDIQTWLHCANIWNKNYTTLAQVLDDSTTLQTLIASNNAVDYMVRSTSWCDDGQNLIPYMTGYDTPSGEVLRSYDDGVENGPAWQVFDNTIFKTNIAPTYGRVSRAVGAYIGYHFPEPVVLKKVELFRVIPYDDTYVFEASNDGTTYTPLATVTETTTVTNRVFIESANDVAYSHYRIRISKKGTVSANYFTNFHIRFFKLRDDVIQNNETAMTYIGLNDYCATKLLKNDIWADALIDSPYYELVLEKSPYMTSNTAPSGYKASASAAASGYPAWHAFDSDVNTMWAGGNTAASATSAARWLLYEFPEAIVLKKFVYRLPSMSSQYPTTDIMLAASNDRTNFTTIYPDFTQSPRTNAVGTINYDLMDNNTAYKYYRLTLTQKNGNSSAVMLPRVVSGVLWGRRYVEE